MCGIWACLSIAEPVFSREDYHQMSQTSKAVANRGPDRSMLAIHPRDFIVFYRLTCQCWAISH